MQYIRYIGLAHMRMITSDEFRQAGYPNVETQSWSYLNNFSVPIDNFTDDVLEGVIKPDPSFVVVGGDEYRPRMLERQMTPAEAVAPRINMMGAVGAGNASAGLSGATPQGFTGSGPTPGGGGGAPTSTTTGPGSGTD